MKSLRRGFAILFLSLCGFAFTAGPAAAEDRPWGYWVKNEKKEVPDYEGKPHIPASEAIKKKRETQEDVRQHVQKELQNSDLTSEKGRRVWEEKDKAVRKARMEELKQEKRDKVEGVKKLRARANEETKERKKDKEKTAAPQGLETKEDKISVPGSPQPEETKAPAPGTL